MQRPAQALSICMEGISWAGYRQFYNPEILYNPFAGMYQTDSNSFELQHLT